jgi:hypothetical protein
MQNANSDNDKNSLLTLASTQAEVDLGKGDARGDPVVEQSCSSLQKDIEDACKHALLPLVVR